MYKTTKFNKYKTRQYLSVDSLFINHPSYDFPPPQAPFETSLE